MYRKSRFILTILLFAFFLSGCDLFKETAVLNYTLGSASAYQSGARIIQTETEYNYAVIDGLRLWVKSFHLATTSGDHITILDNSIPEMIDLSNANDIKRLTGSLSIPPGDYKSVDIKFMDYFQIKAHSSVGGDTFYTSPAGVTTVSSSYGFLEYGFLYVTTGNPEKDSRTSGDTVQFSSPLNIRKDQEYNISFLLDLEHLAFFWNGLGGAGAPFTWYNNEGRPQSDFFPSGQAAFGVQYLPLSLHVSTTSSVPQVETYIIDSNPFTDNSKDDSLGVDTVTVVYPGSGTEVPVFARLRNWDNSAPPFQQFFSGFTPWIGGGFTAMNHEHESQISLFPINKVEGFRRLAVGGTGEFSGIDQTFGGSSVYYQKRIR